MARDKLITIRIEGEKREAFNNLAKSQNTDTASLLYDFINQCLDGTIDISLVTGKGNRLDNQIDNDRIDKLEATTQRLDHWIGALSERVNDWILRSDRRLTDCEQGLTNKMISLEHRLNALASQLDSQRIDRIDTDSQQIDDMEPLIKKALRLDHLDDQRLIDEIEDEIEDEMAGETLPKVETVSTDSSIEPVTGEGTVSNRQGLTNQQLSKKTRVPVSTIEKWKGKMKVGEPIDSKRYPDFFKQWTLNLGDSLWYQRD